ncbi:MAG: hypothetical protein HWN81_09475 [Candidatus Lokiarchaeota archaeon]|nr:hypothetical protein [Candidatus Lokiarchaeota archaeon]
MNLNFRFILGLLLIGLAIYISLYDKKAPVAPPKLEKPSQEVVELVSSLYEIDNRDSAEYSAIFYTMWKEYDKVDINTNLQLQYYLQYLGENVLKGENTGKYPEWSISASGILSQVVGKQDENEPITEEEKKKLKDLLYGFAWKMYIPEYDSVFEEYKDKTLKAIKDYNNEEDDEDPDNPVPPNPIEDCICEGKGYVVHGDGHRSPCPCVESGEECEHDPKCGSSKQEKADYSNSNKTYKSSFFSKVFRCL